jgi:hypothetical protein
VPGQMKIIAFIEYEEVIKKILKHLGFWEVKKRRGLSSSRRLQKA